MGQGDRSPRPRRGLDLRLPAAALLGLVVSAAPASTPGAWTMQRCVRAALEHHPELRLQAYDVIAAQAQLDQARSNLLPRVTWQNQAMYMKPFVDPIVVRSGSLGQMFVPGPGGGVVTNFPPSNIEVFDAPDRWVSTGLVLQQPLFTSGRILLGIRLAEINQHLESQLLDLKRYEVVHLVRQVCLAVLMAEASIRLLDDMRQEMLRILDDTRKLRAQGMVTDADVLEAQANLSQLEEQRARAASELIRAREGLRIMVGAAANDPLALSGGLETSTLPTDARFADDVLDERLARSRPESRARALQRDLAQQQLSMREAEGVLRPTVALSLEGGFRGDRIPLVQTNWTMAWDNYYLAALVLELKLFDGGEAAANARRAASQLAQAKLGVEQTRVLILSELRQALAALAAARARLATTSARVDEHTEKYRIAKQGFDAGMIGRSEFLAQHLEWTEARTSQLVALYELRLAELELERAAGLLPTTPEQVRELAPAP